MAEVKQIISLLEELLVSVTADKKKVEFEDLGKMISVIQLIGNVHGYNSGETQTNQNSRQGIH